MHSEWLWVRLGVVLFLIGFLFLLASWDDSSLGVVDFR
jgi:hypothetical protein